MVLDYKKCYEKLSLEERDYLNKFIDNPLKELKAKINNFIWGMVGIYIIIILWAIIVMIIEVLGYITDAEGQWLTIPLAILWFIVVCVGSWSLLQKSSSLHEERTKYYDDRFQMVRKK